MYIQLWNSSYVSYFYWSCYLWTLILHNMNITILGTCSLFDNVLCMFIVALFSFKTVGRLMFIIWKHPHFLIFFPKSGAQVKVILFSETGERATPFVRQTALNYWPFTAFAFVLWKEEESSLWWNVYVDLIFLFGWTHGDSFFLRLTFYLILQPYFWMCPV